MPLPARCRSNRDQAPPVSGTRHSGGLEVAHRQRRCCDSVNGLLSRRDGCIACRRTPVV